MSPMNLDQLGKITNIISAILVSIMAVIGIVNGIVYGDYKWVTLILVWITTWIFSYASLMTLLQYKKKKYVDWDPLDKTE